jgi:ABC-type microcin C transport system duplicated ATPase subunit YejF
MESLLSCHEPQMPLQPGATTNEFFGAQHEFIAIARTQIVHPKVVVLNEGDRHTSDHAGRRQTQSGHRRDHL